MTKEYVISGDNISSLAAFFEEIERVIIPGAVWGRNLDAFDDILHGGFGTPNDGFILRWQNHEQSKVALGYSETIRVLERRLAHCHSSARAMVLEKISEAKAQRGQTIFEELVEIILDHGNNGAQSEDNVQLVLE